MKRGLFNKEGLTLIEVIVGFALIGILLIPMSSLFLTTHRINQRSRTLLTHTYLAQQYMERAKYAENIDTNPTEIILSDKNVKIIQIIEAHPKAELADRLQKLEIIVKDLRDDREVVKLVGLRKTD